jgi:hypothetical protein
MSTRALLPFWIVAVWASPELTLAHHGIAAYDRSTTVSLEGTVQTFVWENPHALIYLETAAPGHVAEQWIVETAGLVILARAGWNKETLRAGMRCTIVGHPARNGSQTMILERVLMPDGRELGSYVP